MVIKVLNFLSLSGLSAWVGMDEDEIEDYDDDEEDDQKTIKRMKTKRKQKRN